MGFKEKAVVIPLVIISAAVFGFALMNTFCSNSLFRFIGC